MVYQCFAKFPMVFEALDIVRKGDLIVVFARKNRSMIAHHMVSGLNFIGGVAFWASQYGFNRLDALDREKGNKEKGKVVDPTHFFKCLRGSAVRTVLLSFQAAVHLDLAGLGAKYDEHEGLGPQVSAPIRPVLFPSWS